MGKAVKHLLQKINKKSQAPPLSNRLETTVKPQKGFTIVELLIVVVVIAILAAITVVSYNGISSRAKESTLKTDLEGAAKQLHMTKIEDGAFPDDTDAIQKSDATTLDYSHTATSFCLTATNGNLIFHITESSSIQEGGCPVAIAHGSFIQTITSANCPADRTRAVDARDNRTYWVQELDDDKCWMLTNLAYAGGGINTYGDVKAITNSNTLSYIDPYYMIPTGANPTTEPTNPSTSTDGTGQYGYLYNWCAAMGIQATAACANATTPAPVTTTSVCPAGWRLPTGNGGEFAALNNAVNGGLTNTDAGLRSIWLAQRSGYWNSGFYNQGSYGYYWSSTQNSATSAHSLDFSSSNVSPANGNGKRNGFAVRCVAV